MVHVEDKTEGESIREENPKQHSVTLLRLGHMSGFSGIGGSRALISTIWVIEK